MIGLGWPDDDAPFIEVTFRRGDRELNVAAGGVAYKCEFVDTLKHLLRWKACVGRLRRVDDMACSGIYLGGETGHPALWLQNGEDVVVRGAACVKELESPAGRTAYAEFDTGEDGKVLVTGCTPFELVKSIMRPRRVPYGFTNVDLMLHPEVSFAVILYELLYHPLVDASGVGS